MKHDYQYSNLCIPRATILASLSYHTVQTLKEAPPNLTEGMNQVAGRLFGVDEHTTWMSEQHITLMLHRAIHNCFIVTGWLTQHAQYDNKVFNEYIMLHAFAQQIGSSLWKDACANKRIEEGENARPWWDKLFDWLH
jgi:hypothetical protein